MKYVVCTPKHPLALYAQDTLQELGPCIVQDLKLMERTDIMHFLSYIAPCMSRCEHMRQDVLTNILLISGFQHKDKPSFPKTETTIFTLTGSLPSKAYIPLPIDITVTTHGDAHASLYCIETMRFQIDTNKFI